MEERMTEHKQDVPETAAVDTEDNGLVADQEQSPTAPTASQAETGSSEATDGRRVENPNAEDTAGETIVDAGHETPAELEADPDSEESEDGSDHTSEESEDGEPERDLDSEDGMSQRDGDGDQDTAVKTEQLAEEDELNEVLDSREQTSDEQDTSAAEATSDDDDGTDADTNESAEEEEIETTVESVLEAVLFASDEALTPARLANIIEVDTRQVRRHIKELNAKYKANNNAFRIERIAGGFQMLTLSPYNHWLRKLLRARSDNKLSPAALETLAIIAYKQPIIRADIEAIRGVAAGEVIRSLMYKGLVRIVGRAEVIGRPMLYGTTKKFLEVFGLNSIKDLPKVEELKKPEQ